jgi:AraC-like DNA-binding protein
MVRDDSSVFVVALVQHPQLRARITAAARPSLRTRFCETREELRALAHAAGASAVVAEPTDALGAETWHTIAAIRDGFPSLPIVAYCAVGPRLSTDIVRMVRAGAHELLIRDVDDSTHRLRAMLARARTTCTATWARAELAPLVPHQVWSPFEYCLHNAFRNVTVDEVARSAGIDRRTLTRQFARAGLPAPSTVVAWSRLVVAGVLLEDGGRPLEEIALELAFPSASALRSMLNRYTRLRPGEVRENGGGRCVLSAFKTVLRSTRRSVPDTVVPLDISPEAYPERPHRRRRDVSAA